MAFVEGLLINHLRRHLTQTTSKHVLLRPYSGSARLSYVKICLYIRYSNPTYNQGKTKSLFPIFTGLSGAVLISIPSTTADRLLYDITALWPEVDFGAPKEKVLYQRVYIPVKDTLEHLTITMCIVSSQLMYEKSKPALVTQSKHPSTQFTNMQLRCL